MSPEIGGVDPVRPVALVTGAAGGIGTAVVARMLDAGCAVVASDLGLADLPCATARPFAAVPADVTRESDVKALVDTTLERFGRLDRVVHLAGATGHGPIDAVTLEDWQRLLDVNLTSAFLLARACHPALAESRGVLVLTASTNALQGGSALSGPAYAVAKAGVINLTRYLAKEWASEAVRVVCVAPGPVDTPMLGRFESTTRESLRAAIPLGRFATANDIAGIIEVLGGRDASYLTGIVLNASGGLVLD